MPSFSSYSSRDPLSSNQQECPYCHSVRIKSCEPMPTSATKYSMTRDLDKIYGFSHLSNQTKYPMLKNVLAEMERAHQRTVHQGTNYPLTLSDSVSDPYGIRTLQAHSPTPVKLVSNNLTKCSCGFPAKLNSPTLNQKEEELDEWDGCENCREVENEDIFLRILKEAKPIKDCWYHIPIKVNVLKPLPSPETEEQMVEKIGGMIKVANLTLAQAGLALTYDADKDLKFNVETGHGNDGNLNVEHPNAAQKEKNKKKVKNLYEACCNPENPKAELRTRLGRKIVIATDLGPETVGYSVHPTDKDGWLSQMIFLLNRIDENASDLMGRTLAHEFCHTTTLGPYHKYTNSPELSDADQDGHVEPGQKAFDPTNIKHPCNLMRIQRPEDCPDAYLTEVQIQEIRNYIADNRIGKEKTGDDKEVTNNRYKRTPPKEKKEYKKTEKDKDFKNEYKKDEEDFKNEYKKFIENHSREDYHKTSEDKRRLSIKPYTTSHQPKPNPENYYRF